MKNFLKKAGKALDKPRFSWINMAFILSAMGFLLALSLCLPGRESAVGGPALSAAGGEDSCALCGGFRHHAPCLVKLSTGEILEMQVYEYDPEQPWELAQEQPDGFCQLSMGAGTTAIRSTDNHSCSASLPGDTGTAETAYVCPDCRTQLEAVGAGDYVLADLYDLTDIHLYPLTEGATYTIRDYGASVSRDPDNGRLTITVLGLA